MRHGAGPSIQSADSENKEAWIDNIDINSEKMRLGCYFCNDVVAPEDVSNQTKKLKRFIRPEDVVDILQSCQNI